MTNMAQLVTWMDATDDPQERERLNKQLFQIHSMMLSAGVVMAARDPIVFRKLSIRWHHQQPHLDRVSPDVLEQIKPVLVRTVTGHLKKPCHVVTTPTGRFQIYHCRGG